MTFTFTDSETTVHSCDECAFISTERHFRSDEGTLRCTLCRSAASKIDTIDSTDEMSSFRYRQLLDWLQSNKSGVGDATIESIRDEFEDGQRFVDTCERCYETNEFDELTAIDGIGEATAHKKIVLGLSEYYDWTGGKAEIIDFSSE